MVILDIEKIKCILFNFSGVFMSVKKEFSLETNLVTFSLVLLMVNNSGFRRD